MQSNSFAILYQVRQKFLYLSTRTLYRHYSHLVILFLAFFGMLVREKPEVLAWPILHFASHPSDIAMSAVALATWQILVWCWTAIHRKGVSGDHFWTYSQSLALSRYLRQSVNLMILFVCLSIFWIVIGFASFRTLLSSHPSGVDGNFWVYIFLFLLLTLSVANIAAFSTTLGVQASHVVASLALVLVPALIDDRFAGATLVLFFPILLRHIFSPVSASAIPSLVQRTVPGYARRYPGFVLAGIQGRVLLQHMHAVLPRIAAAGLISVLSHWLIGIPGKLDDDRRIFFHIACAASIAILSGLYFLQSSARMKIDSWLSTTALGYIRWKLVENAIVGGIVGAVFLPSYVIHQVNSSFDPYYLLKTYLFYLTLLPILGVDWITRHQNAMLIKLAIVVFAFILGTNIL